MLYYKQYLNDAILTCKMIIGNYSYLARIEKRSLTNREKELIDYYQSKINRLSLNLRIIWFFIGLSRNTLSLEFAKAFTKVKLDSPVKEMYYE